MFGWFINLFFFHQISIRKLYDESFFKEDIIKISEKLPNQIKISLEKGKILLSKLDDDKIKLNNKINDCINIEKNIKCIKEIQSIIEKCNSKKKINLKFLPDNEEINQFFEEIISFGSLIDLGKDYYFRFKFKPGQNYEVTKNGLIATKNNGGN